MKSGLRKNSEAFIAKQLQRKRDEALRAPNEQGLRYAITKFATYYFGALYNDLRFHRKKRIFQGNRPLSDRIAIYLIFPNNGLTASHRDSLRYMKSGGYTPVVVSNHALTDSDRRELLDQTYLVIERHNFGYDFGGYRDAVLALEAHLPNLMHLAILNDSCWFPVQDQMNWFAKAEAMKLDYVGAASHYAFDDTAPELYNSVTWDYRTGHHFFHYTSFALLIGAKILGSQGFLKFWKQFPMTDIKRLVVRRGEAGLTQWVIKNGYTHGATFDLAGFATTIRGLNQAELRKTLAEMPLNFGEDFLKATAKDLLADPNASSEQMANLILTSVKRQGVSYALGKFAIENCGFSFLKKSPLWLSAESSQLMLDFIATLDGDLGAHIRAEAAVLAQRAPKPAAHS